MADLPIAVDLDGTLIKSDTLHEGLVLLVKNDPLRCWRFLAEVHGGKAAAKRWVTRQVTFDPAALPYNEEVLDYLRKQKQSGRTIGLFTAADQSIADAVADYLGLFDFAVGSDGAINLSGSRKAEVIRQTLGDRYVYVGDSAADQSIFETAEAVILAGRVERLRRGLPTDKPVETTFEVPSPSLRAWTRALRIEHWAKNTLVFVPLILGFQLATSGVVLRAVLLFVLLGVLASATYLINDLLDLAADRQHPRKRGRPFAAGTIPIAYGVVAAPLLLAGAFLSGLLLLPPACLLLMGTYLTVTLAYSFVLKQQPIVDVVILAGLFTVRILAGSVLLPMPVSPWLLTFSMFFFLSLAMVKRYSELDRLRRTRTGSVAARGYTEKDLPILLSAGIGAGLTAVVIFMIYLIDEQYPRQIYSNPAYLWAMMPLVLIWLLRVWHLAVHGRMDEDPVVFALRDRFSLGIGALVAFVFVAAAS